MLQNEPFVAKIGVGKKRTGLGTVATLRRVIQLVIYGMKSSYECRKAAKLVMRSRARCAAR